MNKSGQYTLPIARAIVTILNRANSEIEYETWHKSVAMQLDSLVVTPQIFIDRWVSIVSLSDLTEIQRSYLLKTETMKNYGRFLFNYNNQYFYQQYASLLDGNIPIYKKFNSYPFPHTVNIPASELATSDATLNSLEEVALSFDTEEVIDLHESVDFQSMTFAELKSLARKNGIDVDGINKKLALIELLQRHFEN
jgi:hypothetical protein